MLREGYSDLGFTDVPCMKKRQKQGVKLFFNLAELVLET